MERRAGRSMHRAMAVVAIVSMAAPLGGCSTLKGWGFGNGAALGAVGGGVAGLATTIAVRPSSDGGQTAIVLGAALGGVLLGGTIGHFLFDPPPGSPEAPEPPPSTSKPAVPAGVTIE